MCGFHRHCAKGSGLNLAQLSIIASLVAYAFIVACKIRDLDRVSLFESLRRLAEEKGPLGFARQELQA